MRDIDSQVLAEFAQSALNSGMVYFCAWGADCERFHDAVDEIVAADEIGERLFIGPKKHDTIMTTWHDDESLVDAIDFFATLSLPTEGFDDASNYWLAMFVGNPEWAGTIRGRLAALLKS